MDYVKSETTINSIFCMGYIKYQMYTLCETDQRVLREDALFVMGFVVVGVNTATPFGVHQLQKVAQIGLICGQFTHPFLPAAIHLSPRQVACLCQGKAIQFTTSGSHVPEDPPRQIEQSFV